MHDFWEHHGILFIAFMFFFPRLTLLFATAWGGLLWWLGWIFAPRILVAVLATAKFWDANPALVICAWIWALCLEPAEKKGVHKAARRSAGKQADRKAGP